RRGQRHRTGAGTRRRRDHARDARQGRRRMSAAPDRDPYLDLPLDGVRLIEASAGTGKTFTLATLLTRLVVERGLRVGQVLAVTFTEAATQELRKRIRERLLLALELLDTPVGENESAEATITREILRAHGGSGDATEAANGKSGEATEVTDATPAPTPSFPRRRESSDLNEASMPTGLDSRLRGNDDQKHPESAKHALRARLHQAVLEIDLAAIFTIHGFCARALREHALESGQGFDPPTLLANDRDLREELAADLWRAHGSDADGAGDLAALWSGGPSALAARWRTASAPTAPTSSRCFSTRSNARC